MTDLAQELMTPDEAAKWFRRSLSWLRQQDDLLRTSGPGGQPLFHVRVCRAYVLGKLCRLTGEALRSVQIRALASACGVDAEPPLLDSAAVSPREFRRSLAALKAARETGTGGQGDPRPSVHH